MAYTAVGPWTTISSGTFPDPRPAGEKRNVVERTVIRMRKEFVGRYVQYRCTSWYGDACALQHIAVIQGNITRAPCDGGDTCCSNGDIGPCREGEGGCGHDDECEGSLVCGEDNCPWGGGEDCCRQPTISKEDARGRK